MRKVHHATAAFLKSVSLEAGCAHLATLKTMVTKDMFIESCNAMVSQSQDRYRLEPPLQPLHDSSKARELAEVLYTRVVDRVCKEKSDAEKKKEDEEQKKKDAEIKLKLEKPENLLAAVIDKRVKEALVKVNPDPDECMHDAEVKEEPDATQKFVEALNGKGAGRKAKAKEKRGKQGPKKGTANVPQNPAPKNKAV